MLLCFAYVHFTFQDIQAYWQVKSLGSVAWKAMLTPPKILECVKAVEYTLYSLKFFRICLDVQVVLKC